MRPGFRERLSDTWSSFWQTVGIALMRSPAQPMPAGHVNVEDAPECASLADKAALDQLGDAIGVSGQSTSALSGKNCGR